MRQHAVVPSAQHCLVALAHATQAHPVVRRWHPRRRRLRRRHLLVPGHLPHDAGGPRPGRRRVVVVALALPGLAECDVMTRCVLVGAIWRKKDLKKLRIVVRMLRKRNWHAYFGIISYLNLNVITYTVVVPSRSSFHNQNFSHITLLLPLTQ